MKRKANKYALLERQSDRSFYPNIQLQDDTMMHYQESNQDIPYTSLKEQTSQSLDSKTFQMKNMNMNNSYYSINNRERDKVQSNPYAIILPNKSIQNSSINATNNNNKSALYKNTHQNKQSQITTINQKTPNTRNSTVSYFSNNPVYSAMPQIHPPPIPVTPETYQSLYKYSTPNSHINPSSMNQQSVMGSNMKSMMGSNMQPIMRSNMQQPMMGSKIQQQPYIPQVKQTCRFCDCKQMIPGDSDQYYCGKCQEINSCEPKFGLFICRVCNMKVAYPYRTSDHIQCNYCFNLNKVPPFPPKSNQSSRIKLSKLDESAMVLPKELRQQEQLQFPQRKKSIEEEGVFKRQYEKRKVERQQT